MSTGRDGRPPCSKHRRATAGLAAGVFVVELVCTTDDRPVQARGIVGHGVALAGDMLTIEPAGTAHARASRHRVVRVAGG